MVQRIIKNSKLTNRQLGKLIDLFALEVPASKAAQVVKINRHSVDRVYSIIRQKIARECDKKFPFTHLGNVTDAKFIPIIGIVSLDGVIYTGVVSDITREELKSVIRTGIVPPELKNTQSFKLFDALILDCKKYYRINHKEKRQQYKTKVDDVQNFWGYAKTKLKKYYGIQKKLIPIYFKEMEFRFNNIHSGNFGEVVRKIMKSE